MAKCPLCNQRAAKRHCPAKAGMICSVCCATKREIEIDCPSDCRHLQTGRAYETERGNSHPFLPSGAKFNEQFFDEYGTLIAAMAGAVLEERRVLLQLADQDALDAFDALKTTMKTLDAGIYYETQPAAGGAAIAVYRRLKELSDEMMHPKSPDQGAVRVSEIQAGLDFMIATAQFHSGGRPKSRRYLDWLERIVPRSGGTEASRLILP